MPHALDRSTAAAERVFLIRSRQARKTTGAFLTPPGVAQFMASLVDLSRHPHGATLTVLDPGCGTAILAAALVDRVRRERPDLSVDVTLNDLDPEFVNAAHEVLEPDATVQATGGSFIDWAETNATPRFDVIVANPPYMKVSGRTDDGALKKRIEGITAGSTNLYTAFLGIATSLIKAEVGQLVFITPRSFLSGSYFARFRAELASRATPRQLHVFESRTQVFDAVLQETVILHADAGPAPAAAPVRITSSPCTSALTEPDVLTTTTEILWGEDVTSPWAVPTSPSDLDLLSAVRQQPSSLRALSMTVATGPVVPFRVRDRLHSEPGPGRLPLIWLQHVTPDGVKHPVPGFRKPQWYAPVDAHDPLVCRTGAMLALRRFSPKEDERRIVGAFVDASSGGVLVENHLNVIRGATPDVLRGLLRYLTSGHIDRYLRLSSGNTQISATELRRLPLPSRDQLRDLGRPSFSDGQVDQDVASLLSGVRP